MMEESGAMITAPPPGVVGVLSAQFSPLLSLLDMNPGELPGIVPET
jgi:hypothetical protein